MIVIIVIPLVVHATDHILSLCALSTLLVGIELEFILLLILFLLLTLLLLSIINNTTIRLRNTTTTTNITNTCTSEYY